MDEHTCCRSDSDFNPDIAIIGSGSAAFAAATGLADEGRRVTLIERSRQIGGTCVNVGCVPSKIMIRSAELAQHQRANPFDGLPDREPVIDRHMLLAQQQRRVDELRKTKYEDILARRDSINLVYGSATLLSANRIEVVLTDGAKKVINADRILLATGASAAAPDIPGLAETPFWSSTEALQADSVPDHLVVIGSSVVAVELAQAWRRLGAEVTILARTRLLSREDPALGRGLTEAFGREGIRVITGTVPISVEHDGRRFRVAINGDLLDSDALLVAAGRSANTGDLNLNGIGVKTNSHGAIIVDARLRTSVPSIYAAGDCTALPQYVYVAAAAGTRAAINMTGGSAELDLATMPAVTFTDPQVATFGLTESSARKQGTRTDSRTLDLANVPRALANFETDGFVKLVADDASGRLLGAQILAPSAGEMIQSAALAIRNQMTIKDLSDQLFPYLTMVEGLKLCAQAFFKDVRELSCCAG